MHAKERLKIIMETVSGSLSIVEACGKLQISEAAFHKMRKKALREALISLEPGTVGRPPRPPTESDSRVVELEKEITELRIDLEAARIREELAIAMPHVLENRHKRSKKKRKK